LQLSLAIWALIEAYSRQSIKLKVPLMSLKFTLWAQLGVVTSRSITAFAERHLYGSSLLSNAQFSQGFAIIPFLIFIITLNILVDVFSFAEKQRTRQLQIAQLELKSKLRSSLMASSIGHEINQPLSAILLTTELIRNESLALIPEQALIHKRISLIASQSKLVVSTIETMRKLLRNVQTSHVIFELRAAIKTAMIHESRLLQKIKACVKYTGPDDDVRLLGDPGQIQIAIINLLRNSLEAFGESSQLNPRIEINLIHSDETLSIRISDNGPGFPEDTIQAEQQTTTKPTGSGIGLYLVKLTMENHSGSLILGTSPELGGAQATMVFPKLMS
jgi:signal transduction histidine kinase